MDVNRQAAFRKQAWLDYCGVTALLLIALAVPALSFLEAARPSGESLGVWFQRSGAITTVFSMFAAATNKVLVDRLHVPGTWGDDDGLAVLEGFKVRLAVANKLSFGLIVIGTVVWGYGDVIINRLIAG
ncbi:MULTISPECIES: hypothetical protein [unclassified Pseudomonas]|uniref:hypothetical protein n=1 Tax=unclassified Pseudomonas TaxID=196821 RepID=UPI000DA176BD|nr:MULTISPECIES: hypothetical protein [unclassified Pseudomonas]